MEHHINTILFSKKNRKSFFLISLLFLLITNGYSQTNLPKRAKLKTITYSGYTITGYVYKKHFVKDQKLLFRGNTYSYQTNFADNKNIVEDQRSLFRSWTYSYHTNDTILSGRYYCDDDGNSYIDGIRKTRTYITKGIFKITNTENEVGITANKKEGHKLSIILEDMTYYYEINMYEIFILQKLPDNKFSLKIKYKNLLLKTIIPDSIVQKEFNYNFNNYILDSHHVKLSFNSGNVFVGKVKRSSKLPTYCDYDASYAPDSGEYRYASGEVSTGVFECNNLLERFYLEKGVTVFTDGSTCNGDWLFHQNLTYSEIERIYSKDRTPTEMHNMAKSIIEEKEKKLQEKKAAEEQAEKEKLRQQQVLRNRLVEKYGEYYGNKIAEGELVLGMSQEMVNECWPKKYFNISIINRNNNQTVIWEYDKNKIQREITKEGEKSGHEDGALAVILMLNFSDLLGVIDPPKMLVFKNNKLTEIYRY